MTRKPLVLLALLLLAWSVLPAFLKSFLDRGAYELQAPVWSAQATAEDLTAYWVERGRSEAELIAALKDLARRHAADELHRLERRNLRDEVRRLETFFNLPSHRRYQYEVARVVRRDNSAWWQQLTLGKGRAHGITEGAAVVSARGVVGQVRSVRLRTSVVELVSSPSFRMAARFEADPRPVTYRGAGSPPFHPPLGTVAHVQRDLAASATAPLILVSSSLGGVFPEGLPVGRVEALQPGADGLFQDGPVLLDKDLLNLREVAVLIPIDGGEGSSEGEGGGEEEGEP